MVGARFLRWVGANCVAVGAKRLRQSVRVRLVRLCEGYRSSLPGRSVRATRSMGSKRRVPLHAGQRLGFMSLSAPKTKSQLLHLAGMTSI